MSQSGTDPGAGRTTCSAAGQRDGTWQETFTALQARADERGLISWDLNVDSTVCRAHQHAAGARKRGISKRSRPGASPPSRTATALGARAAA